MFHVFIFLWPGQTFTEKGVHGKSCYCIVGNHQFDCETVLFPHAPALVLSPDAIGTVNFFSTSPHSDNWPKEHIYKKRRNSFKSIKLQVCQPRRTCSAKCWFSGRAKVTFVLSLCYTHSIGFGVEFGLSRVWYKYIRMFDGACSASIYAQCTMAG